MANDLKVLDVHTAADGRTVTVMGEPSMTTCALVLMRLIDRRLEEAARERVAKEDANG